MAGDCPVTALGKHGNLCFYLDAVNQLVAVKDKDHSKLKITGLFGNRTEHLYQTWPRRTGDPPVVTGWRQDKAAWIEIPPGLIGRHVYPAAPAVPRPWPQAVAGGAGGPAADLLERLNTWNWRDAMLSPHLMLGWIAAAMIGGAIDWRPVGWVTGGAGTGKSTLIQRLIKHMFDDGLVSSADTTAGGGKIHRGGADHRGVVFEARSCFLFSSINVPPLLGADRSRMAILALDPLAAYARALSAEGYDARGCDVFGTLLACANLALHDAAADYDSAVETEKGPSYTDSG